MTFYVQLAPFSLNKRWRREQQRSHGKIEIASANRQSWEERKKRKKERERKKGCWCSKRPRTWPSLTTHHHCIQHKCLLLSSVAKREVCHHHQVHLSIDLRAIHLAKKIVDLMSCGPSLTKTTKIYARDTAKLNSSLRFGPGQECVFSDAFDIIMAID